MKNQRSDIHSDVNEARRITEDLPQTASDDLAQQD